VIEIAMELGCSAKTVKNALTAAGVTRRKVGSPPEAATGDEGRCQRKDGVGADDPASSAIDVAAERYYPGRSADVLRNRIRASSQILAALAKITGATVELRYTGHPLATGIIAVNCADNRRDPSSVLLCEYFPYRAPGPMFTMQPADGPAFDAYLGEAEYLWTGATPVRF
jgi:hypothetical protein